MNLAGIKDKARRNLPTILGVTAVVAVVAVTVVAIRNVQGENDSLINEINDKLADGTATMIQNADGTIDVFS